MAAQLAGNSTTGAPEVTRPVGTDLRDAEPFQRHDRLVDALIVQDVDHADTQRDVLPNGPFDVREGLAERIPPGNSSVLLTVAGVKRRGQRDAG